MKIPKWIGSALLIFVLAGCYQPKFDEKPFYPLDEEFRSYFAIAGNDSWYVFVDTASGVRDSMWITIADEASRSGIDYENEGYSYQYVSTRTEDFFVLMFSNPKGSSFDMFMLGGGGHKTYKEGGIWGPWPDVKILDSVQVLGKTYYDVLENGEPSLFYERIWFAKGVGIIMKEKRHPLGDTTFLLSKYSLKPL